jgi:hypothetical protein
MIAESEMGKPATVEINGVARLAEALRVRTKG